MKKLIFIIFMMCSFTPSLLMADYVDDKLPSDTSTQIKEGARQIIQLGVKGRHVVKIAKRMLENNFSEEQIVAAFDVLISAKEKGLSEDPLIDKLNEGMAKEVSPDQIIQAVEKVRVRYETAHRYAGMLSDKESHIESLTSEIAECMAAGIEAGDVGQVAKTLVKKAESMRASTARLLGKRTFRTMKAFARSGVPSQEALAVVESAFRNEFNTNDLKGLEYSFTLNAQWAASVSDLAKAYTVAIENGATFTEADLYDPWTTSFGSNIPRGMGPGMPSGGIPVGRGHAVGITPASPGAEPPVAPAGAPPSGTPPQ